MAEYLVIRLGGDDEPATWIAVDGDGTRRSPPVTGPLAEAVRDARQREVVVLVPGTDALTVSADVPARGTRLLAALPFALEEQVAEDVDTLHFAPGRRREDGRLPVAVVSHARMQAWLERLRDAGLEATRIVPENHGLAAVPNTLSLLLAEDQVMFNDGADTAFVMQDVGPAEAVAAAGILDGGAEPKASSRHLLAYAEPSAAAEWEHEFNALRHELASVDLHLLPDGPLPRLAVTVASGAGIDLLQGPYGERTDVAELFRPWRTAAMLLAGVLVLGFAGKLVDLYRLDREQEALRAAFAETWQEIRPGDTREMLDPVAAVNSLRASLGSGTAAAPPVFLPSLQALAEAMAQNQAVKIEAISYRAGVVDVRLSAPDVATLDSIQKSVSATQRFVASIETTGRTADGLTSRIQIRESDS